MPRTCAHWHVFSSSLLFPMSPLTPSASSSPFPLFCPQATLQPPVAGTDVALCHSMALALLGRLLPGSEHLAHELLLSCVFRLEFLP